MNDNKLKSNVNKKNLLKLLPYALIASLFFVLFYNISRVTPKIGDELLLQYTYKGLETDGLVLTRLSGIGDIFTGMKTMYLVYSGRVITHGVLQLFLLSDKIVYDIFNSLIFIITIIFVYLHAVYGRKHNIYVFGLTFLIFWYLVSDFIEVFIWMAGSLCYLWPLTYALIFLFPFRMFLSGKSLKNSNLNAIIMFITGIFAGWSNEHTCFAVALMVLICILYNRIKKHGKLIKWQLTGFISTIIGAIILLIAPGNTVRSGEGTLSDALFNDIAHRILENIDFIIDGTLTTLIIILFLLLFRLFWKKYIRATKKHNIDFFKIVYFVLFIGICAVLSISPIVRERQLLSPISLLFIIIVRFISDIFAIKIPKSKILHSKLIPISIISLVFVIISVDYYKEYSIANYNAQIHNQITSAIEQAVENGERDFVIDDNLLKPLYSNGRFHTEYYYFFSSFSMISLHSNGVWNPLFAKIYNLDTIVRSANFPDATWYFFSKG